MWSFKGLGLIGSVHQNFVYQSARIGDPILGGAYRKSRAVLGSIGLLALEGLQNPKP